MVQVHLHVDCGDEINWIICLFSPRLALALAERQLDEGDEKKILLWQETL
jgi:hypothetical protein